MENTTHFATGAETWLNKSKGLAWIKLIIERMQHVGGSPVV